MENTGKKDKNFVVSIKEYIEKNYADKNISIDFFRELTGYSIWNINEMYKRKYMGLTPVEHLHNIRIKKAKELIKSGVPIGMVANEVGFWSIRTFYRAFEKGAGMPPGQYKQKVFEKYDALKDIIEKQPISPLDYAKMACGNIMYQSDASELYPAGMKEKVSRYSYHQGIFLLGMYRTYKMCGEARYLNYIKEWVDSVIDEDCRVRLFDWYNEQKTREILDAYQPIVLLLNLYQEEDDERYMKVIEYITENFETYPKTRDGILWHARFFPHQIRLNSIYMACPSLCMYGKVIGEAEYYDIASVQPIGMYEKMLDRKTGLLYNSYDETKIADWADPETGLATEIWGRALGYYVMGIVDMLEYLPVDHKNRASVLEVLQKVLDSIAKFQDISGRWYQLVDAGDSNGNYLENSASCMFIYAYAKAINLGLIDKKYENVVLNGYSAVIDTIEYGEHGEMFLPDISEGIDLNALSGYSGSKKFTNDLLGIGPFVLMCTEVEKLIENI